MSEDQVRGNHNPGAGGWPTIRYFNKDTGYEGKTGIHYIINVSTSIIDIVLCLFHGTGKPYSKKTDAAMCDELGQDEYMDAYIMEAGNTVLCSVESLEGCSEKEKKFIDVWKEKTPEEISKEIARIENIKTAKMTVDQKSWFIARIRALKQLDKSSVKAEL